jgi:hypothetical protein
VLNTNHKCLFLPLFTIHNDTTATPMEHSNRWYNTVFEFHLGFFFYRRPRPRPLPRPRPVSIGLGTAIFFFGVSSTRRASRFRLSGSNQALIVDPLTESVAYETGFFPRLQCYAMPYRDDFGNQDQQKWCVELVSVTENKRETNEENRNHLSCMRMEQLCERVIDSELIVLKNAEQEKTQIKPKRLPILPETERAKIRSVRNDRHAVAYTTQHKQLETVAKPSNRTNKKRNGLRTRSPSPS